MKKAVKKINTPTVAFQGEPGAFSEIAALSYFNNRCRPVGVNSFDDVFERVRRRRTLFGIVPIENTLAGSIHQNYDLLERNNLSIAGEIKLRVVHSLLVNKDVSLRMIRTVYSHPQALAQCERFLGSLKGRTIVPVYDTAGAAKMLKEEHRMDAAAIAGDRAARVYGLKVLARGIETDHHNFTRFLIISRKKIIASEHAKTSIVFSVKNIPGALFKTLSVFALRDINLHKIESRPMIGKPWEYLFYVDFEGSIHHTRCSHALRHLREITSYLKILGSYPIGKTVGRAQ